MFPIELKANAFQAKNGEFGWPRTQVPLVVEILRSQSMGILGGELWWVTDTGLYGSLPQRQGPPGVYTWVTERDAGEPWQHFIERSASDTLAAVERWPERDDLPPELPGRVLYNLTWVSETEYDALPNRKQKN